MTPLKKACVSALGLGCWAIACASGPAYGQRANGIAGADDPPGAVPYDLAFQMRAFRLNDPPIVSADGHHLAYVVSTPLETRPQSVRFMPNGTPVNALGAQIHVSGNGGRSQSPGPICTGRGNQWNPAWAPDGNRLAFYSDATGEPKLWIYEPESGNCTQRGDGIIRASLFVGFQPRWSPDSKTLYVPVRPDPPLEMSDATASNQITVDSQGEAGPPLLFYSGSEAEAEQAPSAGGANMGAFLLSRYNATLKAVDVETGETRLLVDARSEPRPSALKVSPSGRWISYASVPSENTSGAQAFAGDLVLVSAAGGDRQVLADGLSSSAVDVQYRWHPDEDRLIYLRDDRLWQVRIGSSGAEEPQELAGSLGKLTRYAYTRNGRAIVVGVRPEGGGGATAALALVPLAGGEPVPLALPDPDQWDFLDLVEAEEGVLWQPESGQVTVQMRHRSTGQEAFYRIDLDTGEAELLTAGLFQLRHFSAGGDHRRLYAVYEDIDTPPDVYRYNARLTEKRRISDIEPRLGDVRSGTVKILETVAPLHDGRLGKVRTTLLLPPGAQQGDRLPAIVMVYSGSDLSTSASRYGGGSGNTVPNQIFTSRGFAVVMADVRLGGYGQPGDPVQEMTDAVLPQIYALADAGYIDINRLAVSGQSYGGYSTGAIISTTNLFRAAISVNGTFDLGSFYAGLGAHGNSTFIHWAENGQGRMGGSPWDNPMRYIENSPYYRIDRIHTPVLIIAGEGDNAVPYEQSTRFFVGLRRLERPAQLAIYPGEGHGIGDWSLDHAVDASRRMVAFLRKHLGEE